MSLPDNLIFEVTQACNHDCLHCYNAWKNSTQYPSGELSSGETIELLGRVVDQVRPRLITLTGGEPLLREDLVAVVDFLVARGVALNLITNGTLLDEQRIDELTPDKISLFEIPLLSSQRETHDRMSGAPGAFDRVTAAIADLKARNQGVICVFVATRLNLEGLEECLELAVALGADGFMLNRFNPGGSGFANLESLQAEPPALQEALDVAESFSVKYDFPISCSIPMPPCLLDTARYERLTFGFCAAGTDRAYYTVDPAGNLRPCNHSTTILGNLLESDFEELIVSEAMSRFKAARPALCRGCRLEDECLGGCKASAEVCYESVDHADPFLNTFRSLMDRPRG